MSDTFKIVVQRGAEKWQAYPHRAGSKGTGAHWNYRGTAELEAKAIEKQWPDVTARVMPADEADREVAK